MFGVPQSNETLIFIPDRNHTRKDWSAVFKPEARRFCDFWGLDYSCIHEFDISQGYDSRREQVYDVVRNHNRPLSTLVFLCHGFPHGMQCGIKRMHLKEFCGLIGDLPYGEYARELNVILYCCSTGDVPGAPKMEERMDGPGLGDNSFADKFRDHLCRVGIDHCTVWSHSTVGHATRNPYVRVFYGEGSPVGGVGGRFPVAPDSELWTDWRKALWSRGEWTTKNYNRNNFRFAFPVLGFDGYVGPIHKTLIEKKVIIP